MIFVHTLGTAQIDAGDARVTPTSARKFAMLLHLAAEQGRRVSKVELRELLFPDKADQKARHSLRELVYELRQSGVEIETDGSGIELAVGAVRSDFSEVIERERPDVSQLRAVEGGFLPGYAPTHSEAYAEWFEGFRAKSVFALSRALLKETARAKGAGDWLMTERAARACLALDPLNEEATLALAEMMAIGGARVQAVRLLETYSAEVGSSGDLRFPAAVLKRRIGERLPASYQVRSDLPFVGREAEMRVLADRLARARTGQSQCVVLVGEAGIGKSRLAAEYTALAALQGACVQRIAIQPQDVHRPLSAFLDLVPPLREAPGALGCSPAALALLDRLGTGSEGGGAQRLDRPSEDLYYETIGAITDLIDAVATESVLVLVVEDVHWLDTVSLTAFTHLMSASIARRVLVILTGRPEKDWATAFRHADRITLRQLPGLDDQAVTDLVEQALPNGAARSDEELTRWICAAASGNPLFVSVLVSQFASTGIRFDVPPTLHDLLVRRIQELSSRTQAVLAICALLSRHCTLERLVAAAEIPSLELMTALGELEEARLLRYADDGLSAPHALISDVLIAESPKLLVATAHRRIAQLLETEAADGAGSVGLWDSGNHWMLAGDTERAIGVFRRCAKHALDIGRPREGAELLIRGSALVTATRRQSLLLEAADAASRSNEHDLILHITKCLRRYGWTPDHDRIELAELEATWNWRDDTGDVVDSLRRCIRGEQISEEHRLGAAYTLLAFAATHQDPQLAAEAYDILGPAIQAGTVDEEFRLNALAVYHLVLGDYNDCPRLTQEMVALAERSPAHRAAALRRRAGVITMRAGNAMGAIAILKDGFADACASGLVKTQFDIAMMVATVAMDEGLVDVSAEWTAVSEDLVRAFPEFRQLILFLAHQSDLASSRKDVEALRRCRKDAEALLSREPSRRTRRWIRALDVQISALSGHSLATAVTVASLVAHHELNSEIGDMSDFETGVAIRVLEAAGDVEQARNLLRRYLTQYRRTPAVMWSSLREAARDIGMLQETVSLLQQKARQNPLDVRALVTETEGLPGGRQT